MKLINEEGIINLDKTLCNLDEAYQFLLSNTINYLKI